MGTEKTFEFQTTLQNAGFFEQNDDANNFVQVSTTLDGTQTPVEFDKKGKGKAGEKSLDPNSNVYVQIKPNVFETASCSTKGLKFFQLANGLISKGNLSQGLKDLSQSFQASESCVESLHGEGLNKIKKIKIPSAVRSVEAAKLFAVNPLISKFLSFRLANQKGTLFVPGASQELSLLANEVEGQKNYVFIDVNFAEAQKVEEVRDFIQGFKNQTEVFYKKIKKDPNWSVDQSLGNLPPDIGSQLQALLKTGQVIDENHYDLPWVAPQVVALQPQIESSSHVATDSGVPDLAVTPPSVAPTSAIDSSPVVGDIKGPNTPHVKIIHRDINDKDDDEGQALVSLMITLAVTGGLSVGGTFLTIHQKREFYRNRLKKVEASLQSVDRQISYLKALHTFPVNLNEAARDLTVSRLQDLRDALNYYAQQYKREIGEKADKSVALPVNSKGEVIARTDLMTLAAEVSRSSDLISLKVCCDHYLNQWPKNSTQTTDRVSDYKKASQDNAKHSSFFGSLVTQLKSIDKEGLTPVDADNLNTSITLCQLLMERADLNHVYYENALITTGLLKVVRPKADLVKDLTVSLAEMKAFAQQLENALTAYRSNPPALIAAVNRHSHAFLGKNLSCSAKVTGLEQTRSISHTPPTRVARPPRSSITAPPLNLEPENSLAPAAQPVGDVTGEFEIPEIRSDSVVAVPPTPPVVPSPLLAEQSSGPAIPQEGTIIPLGDDDLIIPETDVREDSFAAVGMEVRNLDEARGTTAPLPQPSALPANIAPPPPQVNGAVQSPPVSPGVRTPYISAARLRVIQAPVLPPEAITNDPPPVVMVIRIPVADAEAGLTLDGLAVPDQTLPAASLDPQASVGPAIPFVSSDKNGIKASKIKLCSALVRLFFPEGTWGNYDLRNPDSFNRSDLLTAMGSTVGSIGKGGVAREVEDTYQRDTGRPLEAVEKGLLYADLLTYNPPATLTAQALIQRMSRNVQRAFPKPAPLETMQVESPTPISIQRLLQLCGMWTVEDQGDGKKGKEISTPDQLNQVQRYIRELMQMEDFIEAALSRTDLSETERVEWSVLVPQVYEMRAALVQKTTTYFAALIQEIKQWDESAKKDPEGIVESIKNQRTTLLNFLKLAIQLVNKPNLPEEYIQNLKGTIAVIVDTMEAQNNALEMLHTIFEKANLRESDTLRQAQGQTDEIMSTLVQAKRILENVAAQVTVAIPAIVVERARRAVSGGPEESERERIPFFMSVYGIANPGQLGSSLAGSAAPLKDTLSRSFSDEERRRLNGLQISLAGNGTQRDLLIPIYQALQAQDPHSAQQIMETVSKINGNGQNLALRVTMLLEYLLLTPEQKNWLNTQALATSARERLAGRRSNSGAFMLSIPPAPATPQPSQNKENARRRNSETMYKTTHPSATALESMACGYFGIAEAQWNGSDLSEPQKIFQRYTLLRDVFRSAGNSDYASVASDFLSEDTILLNNGVTPELRAELCLHQVTSTIEKVSGEVFRVGVEGILERHRVADELKDFVQQRAEEAAEKMREELRRDPLKDLERR